jgi:SSS family solute:Na+ symporter
VIVTGELDLRLLTAFIVYSLIILGVGVWGYRKKSFEAYAVAERSMGLGLATTAFVATFLSAVTIIGVSGYASINGWAAAAFTCYGYALGWVLLVVAARRLYDVRLTTVPEFLGVRYESKGLRAFAALTVIALYSITLVVQLLAIGITMNTLIGTGVTFSILLVGVIFVSYTMLGGLVSVLRTDMIQAGLLGAGVLLAAGVVLWETRGTVITAPPAELGSFFGGSVASTSDFVGWMLVWGLGIPTQSYYLHRFYASRSARVARGQIALGALFVMVILVSVIIIGTGAGMLIPPNEVGDGAFPYLVKNVIGGWISLPILLAITAAIHSTTDGLLHIVGLYFSVDVYETLKGKMEGAELLKVSRGATLVFGAIVTLVAAYVSTNPIPLISLVGAIAWGGMASALFAPLFAGMFWRGATRAGALASASGGLVFAIGAFTLRRLELITLHEIYPGLITSLVLMFVVSRFTAATSEPTLERFFPATPATAITMP